MVPACPHALQCLNVQSKWRQTTVCAASYYNYYTPPYGNGSEARTSVTPPAPDGVSSLIGSSDVRRFHL